MPTLRTLCTRYRVAPGARVRLGAYDPKDTRAAGADKETADAQRQRLTGELDALQDLLYAQKQHRILLVLQGMDTAGKDSTIRRVFRTVDPLGVRVANFRAPSADDLAHDYLWRVHRQVPGDGELVIFNRSHYEDVLVARAHGELSRAQQHRRLRHIADFERMLTDEGTTLIKCFLHISLAEQRNRLLDRLNDPTKQWKFDYSDIRQRALWHEYRAAYQDAISATSTPQAPWYIVPADHKWVRDLVVSAILVYTLKGLRMRYPPPPPDLDQISFD